jgi:hypothetical protein
MRETYSTLLQAAQDLCVDSTTVTTTGVSDTQTFLARNINSTIQYLFGLIKNYKTQPLPRTFTTVIDQDFYHYPPGLLSLDSVTIAIGDIQKPLKVVSSQRHWNALKEIPNSGDFPEYFFPRQSDFGIWPTPSIARTGTVIGNYYPQRISVEDYTDGTVTVAQNTRTITGVGTTFTADMVGRWFSQTDSTGLSIGNLYRLSGYTDASTMTLETFFEESSLMSSTFLIAQSPELPEELHEFIPYRAAAAYYRGPRRDQARAQEYMNFFFTGDDGNPNRGGGIRGGVLGVINEYKNKGRANNQMIGTHRIYRGYVPEAWKTTLEVSA